MPAKDNVSKNQFHMHLYHGTSASNLPSIEQIGVGENVGHQRRAYLTSDYDLAAHYASNHEDPAVVTVRANPRNLRVDWNSFDEPVYGYDEGKNRTFNPKKLRNDSTDWKNALRETGAVVHEGAVPPENIIGVEKL